MLNQHNHGRYTHKIFHLNTTMLKTLWKVLKDVKRAVKNQVLLGSGLPRFHEPISGTQLEETVTNFENLGKVTASCSQYNHISTQI